MLSGTGNYKVIISLVYRILKITTYKVFGIIAHDLFLVRACDILNVFLYIHYHIFLLFLAGFKRSVKLTNPNVVLMIFYANVNIPKDTMVTVYNILASKKMSKLKLKMTTFSKQDSLCIWKLMKICKVNVYVFLKMCFFMWSCCWFFLLENMIQHALFS